MKELTTKTYFEIEYSELETLLSEVFGFEINLIAEEEWNNDSSYTFLVEENDSDDFDYWLEKWQWPGLSVILDGLAYNKVIPVGDYLIKVSW